MRLHFHFYSLGKVSVRFPFFCAVSDSEMRTEITLVQNGVGKEKGAKKMFTNPLKVCQIQGNVWAIDRHLGVLHIMLVLL